MLMAKYLTDSVYVLVNDCMMEEIGIQRGLKQGNPFGVFFLPFSVVGS